MNRRSFMTAMAALMAAPKMLLALKPDSDNVLRYGVNGDPPIPILYGDGIGDDTEALQALVDGFPVWDAQQKQVVPFVSGRALRTTATIYVDPRRPQGPIDGNAVRVLNCNVHYTADAGYALVYLPQWEPKIDNLYLSA